MCRDKSKCNLTASNSTFTDNCPNVVKQLKVWYQCVALPIKTTGGNAGGANCYFPFNYKSTSYYQCTYEQHPDYVNKRWCCTTPDCTTDFKWGVCPESKPNLQSDCSKPGYSSVDNGLNCYKIFEDNPKTWKDARDYCQQQEGGKLVSIRDGFEQSYVSLLSYVDTLSTPWIGLIRNNSDTYYWSDDWPVDYTNWAAGWLADSSSESCAYFDSTSGTWNSSDCNVMRPFMCKISNETVPVM